MMLPLVIITGPTAVGKTSISIRLAKKINGEIVSADSMQVYRRMDIGTAKIRKEEMEGIPHYLIDEYEPQEEFNVYLFQKAAQKYISDIHKRGKIPILVGGTGFYIQSVLYGIDFTENDDNREIRNRLIREAEVDGGKRLYRHLQEIDPAATEYIHENNVKRIIRAIEFYEMTGNRISEHNIEQREHKPCYRSAYFVLTMNRSALYRNIEFRIEQMLRNGLVEEVEALMEEGCNSDMVSMKGLGYKEILAYLNGAYSLEEAVSILKRDTRHFAKRQLTWFRRERDVIWINKDEYRKVMDDENSKIDEDKILNTMLEHLTLQGIITRV